MKHTMYFEGRELTSFSQPISRQQLKVGEVYFVVVFVDRDMLVPTLETYVFIGSNLEPEDEGKLYFQDVSSHQQGITFSSSTPDDDAVFLCQSESKLKMMFDFENALNELLKCSLRRNKSS